MSYMALYRKFRPTRFSEVKGQDHIVKTLENQMRTGRIGHAYLFCGTRGTGKTTVAKILAKAVNCEHPVDGEPCGECEVCKAIAEGSSMNVIEIDAASNNGVDNIREIREEVAYRPTEGKYKVYIIDEVHMLSTGAFNALLKTLEEPPSYVIFILATTEVHKLPQTILSRCQRFDFHRIPTRVIADRLLYVAQQEDVMLADSAAVLIASVADGALRDALSLLDRCIAMSTNIDDEVVRNAAGLARKTYLYDLAAAVINKSTEKSLDIIDRLYAESKDMSRLCEELLSHFRALMLIKSVRNPRDILVMSDEEFEEAQTQADYLSLADIVYYMDVLSRSYQRMGHGTGDRTEFEMAMVKLSSAELDGTTEALTARLTALEKAVKRGIKVSTEPIATPVRQAEQSDETTTVAKQPVKEESVQVDDIEEPKQETSQEHKPAPVTKPAPKVTSQPAVNNSANLEEIYRNAKPFPEWVDVVGNLKDISRAIAAAFAGSSAYVSGNYLLIDTSNEMAFELLRQGKRREEVKKIILETTGRAYSLGPYKRVSKEEKKEDSLEVFKKSLEGTGVEIIEE